MSDIDRDLYHAEIAEQSERYEDMKMYMKNVAKKAKKPLESSERNLFSVAYKNAVGARRASWRIICSLESKSDKDQPKLEIIQEYRKKVEQELRDVCEDALESIDLLLEVVDKEDVGSQAFYHKMKADYYRYQAEIAVGEDKEKPMTESQKSYETATDVAKSKLEPTHPTVLGLALNFSVYYYEIVNDRKKACEVAKEAFDAAIPELNNVPEDQYKDSTLIMQLLRDNLTLWTSEQNDEDAPEGTEDS